MGIMQLLHLIFIYAVQFRYLIFWFLTIRRKQSFQAEKRNYLKSWPLLYLYLAEVRPWRVACGLDIQPAGSALLPLRSPPPLWLLLNYLHFSFLQKISEKLGDDRLAGAVVRLVGRGDEKFINSGQSPAPARSITPPRSQSSTDTDHGPWTDTRWSQSLSCFNNHDIDIDIKHFFRLEGQCLF